MKKNTFIAIIGIITIVSITILLIIIGSNKNRYQIAQKIYWGYLDTVNIVQVEYDTKEVKKEVLTEALNGVQDILFNIEKWFSIEQTPMMLGNGIASSQLMDVNDNAGIKPVEVSQEFMDILKLSLEIYEMTEGYFNPTIGPLSRLWDISGKAENCYAGHDDHDDCTIPKAEEIAAVLPLLNPEKIIINEEQRTVFLEEPGMKLDFGGIAKGYATDLILEYLKSYSFSAIYISLGGNVYLYGEPKNTEVKKGWYTGIENSLYDESLGTEGKVIGYTHRQNVTVVTSGIYKRYIEVDGIIYSHLLDTKTGYPFESNLMSVTIISENSTLSDALATGVYGLGMEKGTQLIKSLEGYGVIYVTADKKVYYTNNIDFDPDPFLINQGYEYIILE